MREGQPNKGGTPFRYASAARVSVADAGDCFTAKPALLLHEERHGDRIFGREGGQAACSLLAFTPMATAETGGQEGFDATHGEGALCIAIQIRLSMRANPIDVAAP